MTDLIDIGERRVLAQLRHSWDCRRPPDLRPVIVDVGANKGDWTAAALEAFPGPRPPRPLVLAFEPQASAFEAVTARFEDDDQVLTYPVGIALQKGFRTLRRTTADSCVIATFTDRAEDTYDPSVKLSESEEVYTYPLDSLPSEFDVFRVDILKLDVEGHEYEALRSAAGLLAESLLPVIQFEFNANARAAGVGFRQLWDLLAPTHDLCEITPAGEWAFVSEYSPAYEHDGHRNYLAVARDRRWFIWPWEKP